MSYPMPPFGGIAPTAELPIVSPDRIAAMATEPVPLLYPGHDTAAATSAWNQRYYSAITPEPAASPPAEQAPNLFDYWRNRRSNQQPPVNPALQLGPSVRYDHPVAQPPIAAPNQLAYAPPNFPYQPNAAPSQNFPPRREARVSIGDVHQQRRAASLFMGGTLIAGAVTGVSEYAAAGTETGQVIGFGACLALAIKIVGGHVRRVHKAEDERQAEQLAKALDKLTR